MPKETAQPKRRLRAQADEPKPTIHVRLIPAYAIEIEELPGIKTIGITKSSARAYLFSELARRYPQGYTLEWKEPLEL